MNRRRSTVFTDIIEACAKQHWKAGVVAAVLSFLVLHIVTAVFGSSSQGPKTLSDFAHALPGQFIGTFANIFQYIVPLACLVGAVVSFVRRSRGLVLFKGVQSLGPPAVDAMTWSEFELLIATIFRAKGFFVIDNVIGGPDGGVDLQLRKDDEIFLVQCKQWRTKKVGVATIRELYGVVTAQGATGGYVISSGRFSEEAQSFAAKCKIVLIDGAHLSLLIANTLQSNVVPINRQMPASQTAPHFKAPAPPTCRRCGGEMVLRTARKGSTPGSKFWGCSKFPKCRATAQVVAAN